MKRAKAISIFVIAAASMLLVSIKGFAADVRGCIDAKVCVERVFELEDVTPLSIDFGEVDPGPDSMTDEIALNFTCDTNINSPWEVSIWVTSPLTSELTTGVFTIPNENFFWKAKSNRGGEWQGYLDTSPIAFYSSNKSEAIEFNVKLNVEIPTNQAAGMYATTMYVKMKEKNGATPQEVSKHMDVKLRVNSRFTMSVSPSSLKFGMVEPGKTTEAKDLSIVCSTNNNNPWNVSIHAIHELYELASGGVDKIPNDNFRWRYKETGYGKAMATTPFTFYECKTDEYITSPDVELSLTFDIHIPPAQIKGKYATTLVLTMTQVGGGVPPPR